jgi:DNA-binding MarR family transcriptional regulator
MNNAFRLEDFLPFQLNQAAENVSLAFAAQYKAHSNLTRPEWRTLAALGSFGRMTATAICAHSKMHKTKVSRALFALEQRKWLRRFADQDDRRVEQIELTQLGRRHYADLSALALAYQQALAAALGPDGLSDLVKSLSIAQAAAARTNAQHAAGRKRSSNR